MKQTQFDIALRQLIPMMLRLSDLGRQLERDGKIKVEYGEDYSIAALNYVCLQYGAQNSVSAE